MQAFDPHDAHLNLLRDAPRRLAFDPKRDFQEWRQEVNAKFSELVGRLPEPCPLSLRCEYEREHEEFVERRIVFASEANVDVPAHLLIPRAVALPVPVVICLQGHSTGMHISLGRPKYPGDEESIKGDRDFALQAVRQGFAALAIEQRCFGERKDNRPAEVRHFTNVCQHSTMVALLLGRTMVGERVWDVSRAIDALGEFEDVDATRIACMGNSGGGTITYYAACLEPRISAAMPSCSVCTYRDSIGSIDHCADNYVPGVLQYFDMADLAGLIAPRPLVVVAGREDPIFPIRGVEEAFDTISRIYLAADAPDTCTLVVGEGGHRFYAAEAWPVFRKVTGW